MEAWESLFQMNRTLQFPVRGISDSTAFVAQTGAASVPPTALQNVRPFDVSKQRGRGGQRPGAWTVFDTQICNGKPIQLLSVVSKSSVVTDYLASACTDVTEWENRNGAAIGGQVWMLGSQPGMFRSFSDTRFTGSSTKLGVAVRWHPLITNDIRRAFYAAHFVDAGASVNGGQDFIGIACVDELGASIWTANLEDKQAGGALPGSPRDLYANHIEVVAPALGEALVLVSVLATTGTIVEGFVYVYKASDGTYLKRYNVDGWAGEVQQTAVRTDGKVAVLFFGSGGAIPGETCVDGTPVEGGGFAQHFRSGIALYHVTGDAANPLQRERFGPTPPAYAKVETTIHGYWRFSEQLLGRIPLGAYPTSIAAGPDSSLLVTYTNKGWGPNASFPPADNASIYSTAAYLNSEGTVVWETDTNSIRRDYTVGTDTWHNDIPDSGDPFGSNPPSLFAAAVGENGALFVGGARNSSSSTASAGFNLFRLSPVDGRVIWSSNVGGAAAAFSGGVAQGALKVDPTDGNIVVAGYRNAAFTGAGTANAHLWKFSSETGNLLWSYDLKQASKHAQSVDVDDRGRLVYSTTFV